MITEGTTTQDLIATIANARHLSEVSFETGCTVLDAIEMFDRRAAGGKLGTWQEYSAAGRNSLRFAPKTEAWDDRDALVCEKLAQDVVIWTRLSCDPAAATALFTAWVVIDRATRVTWVECSLVQDQQAIHPRYLREAGEFPSSSRGTVSCHMFLRMGGSWHEVLDSVLGAYQRAKDLFDLCAGCDHSRAQDAAVALTDLNVTDGAVGIRTSQLVKPVHLRTRTVSGVGSVGIDLDD